MIRKEGCLFLTREHSMAFSKNTSRKIQVALGVAVVAGSLGTTVKALAGPSLSSLVNLTNGGEVTVNNTLGQSFSVNGAINSDITPFAAASAATLLQTGAVRFAADTAVTVSTLGLNPMLGIKAGSFNSVIGQVSGAAITSGVIEFASLATLTIVAACAVTTVGAAITNTVFGPSNVKASSAFTNQVTTSLTAF